MQTIGNIPKSYIEKVDVPDIPSPPSMKSSGNICINKIKNVKHVSSPILSPEHDKPGFNDLKCASRVPPRPGMCILGETC